MSREDVEDDLTAINDLGPGLFFDGLALRWGQVIVEDDQIRLGVEDCLFQLGDLAATQACGRIGVIAELDHLADDIGSGGLDQPLDFVERAFLTSLVTRIEHRDQKGSL